MENELLTIPQAAQLLNVCKDTVRRRIKLGEIKAEKREGPYGEQWVLPADQFNQAAVIQDVIPLTRQVSVAELQAAMRHVIAEVVKEETAEMKAEVANLKEQIEATQGLLDGHYKLVDERLRQVMDTKIKKSWWTRMFG